MKRRKQQRPEQVEMFELEEVLPLFTGTPERVPFEGLLEGQPRPLPEGRSGRELPLPQGEEE